MAQYIPPPGEKLPQVLNDLRTRLKRTEHHIEALYSGSSDTTGPLLTWSTTLPPIGNLGDTWFYTDTSGNILGTYQCTAAYASGSGVTGDWALQQYDTPSITPQAVTSGLLAPSAVASGNIQANAVASAHLQASSVTSAAVAANAIASGNLQTSSVTSAAVAANAIASGNLQSSAVTSAKLAPSAVASGNIQGSAVQTSHIANNAVTSAQVANNTLTSAQIAPSAGIYGSQIASINGGTVGNTGTALNQNPYFLNADTTTWAAFNSTIAGVTGSTLTAAAPNPPFPSAVQVVNTGSSSGKVIQTGAPYPAQNSTQYQLSAWVYTPNTNVFFGSYFGLNGAQTNFSGGTVSVTANTWTYITTIVTSPASSTNTGIIAVGPNATSTTMYATGITVAPQVPGTLIQASSVTSGQLAPSAVTSGIIAGSAVQTSHIATSAITGPTVAAGAVTSGNIGTGAVNTSHIATSAVTSAAMATSAISSGAIQGNAVATQHIQSAAVTSAQVATAAINASHAGASQFGLNMIPDPTFANTALNALRIAAPTLNTWTISGGAASTVQTTTRSWLYLTPASALWLNPGEQYYLSVTIACTGAQGGAVGIGIANTAGTVFADLANTFSASTGTGAYTLSGVVTIPAGFGTTGFIRLYTGADGSHTPTVTFTNPVCQPATLFSPTLKGGLIDSATINGSTINVDSVVDGGLFAYTQSNTASNANSQFTSNVTSWTGTNTAISWVTGSPPHMLMTTTGSNAISVANTHTTVTPGNSIAIEFSAGITAGISVALQCQFFTAGNALISTLSTPAITTTSGNVFNVATVPTSASYAVLTIVGVGTAMSATATLAALYVNSLLQSSMSPANTLADQYGNTIVQGVATYDASNTGAYAAINASSHYIVDKNSNLWAISWFLSGSTPYLEISTPAGTSNLFIDQNGFVCATDPVGGAFATWHSASLSNSWTGSLQVKLMADNTVQIYALLTVPGGVANPSTITTVGAGWRPSSTTQPLNCSENSGTTPFPAGSKVCEILTTGVIRIYDAIAGETVRIMGRYPLDL